MCGLAASVIVAPPLRETLLTLRMGQGTIRLRMRGLTRATSEDDPNREARESTTVEEERGLSPWSARLERPPSRVAAALRTSQPGDRARSRATGLRRAWPLFGAAGRRVALRLLGAALAVSVGSNVEAREPAGRRPASKSGVSAGSGRASIRADAARSADAGRSAAAVGPGTTAPRPPVGVGGRGTEGAGGVPASAEPASAVGATGSAGSPAPPEGWQLRGLENPVEPSIRPSRKFANALLWPLRATVDLVFLATGMAGGLLENEQLVPRARELFFTRGGELGVFPTVFLETGVNPNIGMRIIGSAGPLVSSLRGGYGGPDANVVEGRLQLAVQRPNPTVVWLEWMHDRRTGLGFLGVGQNPESDPRNHFRAGPQVGLFRERRERLILGYGWRPAPDLEVMMSTSYAQRYDEPPRESLERALEAVFEPESIVGGGERQSRVLYSEVAARYDNRAGRWIVGTGVMSEIYGGVSEGVGWDDSRFVRAGFRLAGFLPFVRRTTILSPQVVVDTLSPLGGRPVPFRELTGQPSFRGINNRRDFDSVVMSLDYRWYVVPFLAGRLFVDVAKVVPSLAQWNFDDLRWATGLGFDLHTAETQIGRVAVAVSPDGARFNFSLGVPSRFGDRQHRD